MWSKLNEIVTSLVYKKRTSYLSNVENLWSCSVNKTIILHKYSYVRDLIKSSATDYWEVCVCVWGFFNEMISFWHTDLILVWYALYNMSSFNTTSHFLLVSSFISTVTARDWSVHHQLCTLSFNRLLFNNQPEALFIKIYSVIKLYMFWATSLPIIRSLLLYIHFQAQSGCSILTLLGNGHHNLHEAYQCQMYSRRLLMMGKEVAWNMHSFMTE